MRGQSLRFLISIASALLLDAAGVIGVAACVIMTHSVAPRGHLLSRASDLKDNVAQTARSGKMWAEAFSGFLSACFDAKGDCENAFEKRP